MANKKYRVIDLQKTGFMNDTRDDPMASEELIERFWALDEARTEKKKDFTVDYIQEMWEVRFEEVKEYLVDYRDGEFSTTVWARNGKEAIRKAENKELWKCGGQLWQDYIKVFYESELLTR